MECVQKQVVTDLEQSSPAKVRRTYRIRQIDVYDKKAAEYRRYLASEEGIRRLERTRDLSLSAVQRMSFIR